MLLCISASSVPVVCYNLFLHIFETASLCITILILRATGNEGTVEKLFDDLFEIYIVTTIILADIRKLVRCPVSKFLGLARTRGDDPKNVNASGTGTIDPNSYA